LEDLKVNDCAEKAFETTTEAEFDSIEKSILSVETYEGSMHPK
jgi:hypothetical protein